MLKFNSQDSWLKYITLKMDNERNDNDNNTNMFSSWDSALNIT